MKRPFFRNKNISIYLDDFLNTKTIEKESIDLIITSPPYDLSIEYEKYDDSIPYNEYLQFTKKWLKKSYDLSKDDGRMCLNIPLDKSKGGKQSVYGDILNIAKNTGWEYNTTIIWNEQNISKRTAWGSWLSASAPYIIAPVEIILIMYKKNWKKSIKGQSTITKEEFIEWTNGVWTFNGEKKKKIGHPAPFPLELSDRCIKLFSFEGDTILDPFVGSGTTLLSCRINNRKGIGIEINNKYCGLAKKRLLEHNIK